MIVKKIHEVAKVYFDDNGIKGVSKQKLISSEDGAPNFTMRKFDVRPGGYTPYHTHDFEHEVFVLKGKGLVRGREDIEIHEGMALLVEPGEEHQFVNTGDGTLEFLCIVPNYGEK